MTFSTSNFRPRTPWSWTAWTAAALALVFAADRLLLSIYRHPTPQQAEAARLDDGTRIIFMGSSRTQTNIDPLLFADRASNVSDAGLVFYFMEPLATRLMERARNLKFLVIELTLESLVFTYDPAAQKFSRSMAPFGITNGDYAQDAAPFSDAWWRQVLPGIFTYRLTPRLFFADSVFASSSTPYASGHLPLNRMLRPEEDLIMLRSKLQGVEESRVKYGTAANEKALLAILASAKRRGVTVILLRHPLHRQYAAETPVAWIKAMDAALELAVRRSLITPAQIIDDRSVFDGQDQYFADMEHLNKEGAKVFSRLLQQQVN